MTLFALTGTPGVGKTTISKGLRAKGYDVIDLHQYIVDNGLLGSFDKKMDSFNVDTCALSGSLEHLKNKEHTVILDGHLAHFVDCDTIIVIRCAPSVIYERLERRGYDHEKILENVQAEVLDVILCESIDTGLPTFEIDCTSLTVDESVERTEDIIHKKTNDYQPGNVNWTEEMEKWF
ncbi:MAG: adenylate kinase family protein [Candidatus Methanomethylophilaceae archaeon]